LRHSSNPRVQHHRRRLARQPRRTSWPRVAVSAANDGESWQARHMLIQPGRAGRADPVHDLSFIRALAWGARWYTIDDRPPGAVGRRPQSDTWRSAARRSDSAPSSPRRRRLVPETVNPARRDRPPATWKPRPSRGGAGTYHDVQRQAVVTWIPCQAGSQLVRPASTENATHGSPTVVHRRCSAGAHPRTRRARTIKYARCFRWA
jgi:hypothetical protein